MAKMIPELMGSEVQSNAEKKFFRLLQLLPGTEHWTVLHSVGISRHPTQSQGEADFVLLIPEMGVFVLEVKGGRISYETGRWHTTNRYGEKKSIDPARQANEGMQALKAFVEDSARNTEQLSYAVFGFGVVFPDASFPAQIQLPDVSREQIADKEDLLDVRTYVEKLSRFWRSRHIHNPKVFPPNKRQTDLLISILRPQFEARALLPAFIKNFDQEAIILTENQQMIFDSLLENDRCLIRGSAGTGKTILAMNYVDTLESAGKTFGFFCYNLKLAQYLSERVQAKKPSVCSSLTDYMEETVRAYFSESRMLAAKSDINQFYQSLLPELFMEAMLEQSMEQLDVLVLDEAQDLLTAPYMEVLDLLLKDGLEKGRWCIFLDAEQQNVYHQDQRYEDIHTMISRASSFFTKYALKDNCRNTPAIIQYVDSIFGLETRFRFREEHGPTVIEKSYKNRKDLAGKVNSLLAHLLSEGIQPQMISLLSPNRMEGSVAEDLTACRISEVQEDGAIHFSTISGFKGLENQVVILIEVDLLEREYNQRLLYVGATRAKSALYVFTSEKSKIQLDKMKGH